MKLVYTTHKLEGAGTELFKNGSIFLAGPTVRPEDLGRVAHKELWRRTALDLLADFGFNGVVFVPEFEPVDKDAEQYRKGTPYETIYEWEADALGIADVIMFWVPRDLNILPGFTTNIEFGAWMHSKKVVFGAPPNAPHTGYMLHWCKKLGIPTSETLEGTVHRAILANTLWIKEKAAPLPIQLKMNPHPKPEPDPVPTATAPARTRAYGTY